MASDNGDDNEVLPGMGLDESEMVEIDNINDSQDNLEDLAAIQTAALAEVAKQEEEAQGNKDRSRSRSPNNRNRRGGNRDRGGRGGRGDRGGNRRRDSDRNRDGPKRTPTYTSIPGAKTKKIIRYECCVFISNIDYKVTWQELKDVLKREVGDVGYVEMFTKKDGSSQGCAFVEFKMKEDVKKAMEKMDRYEMHSRKLVIKEDSEGKHSEKFFRQREDSQKAKQVLTPQVLQQMNLDPANVCDTVYVANLNFDVDWKKLKSVFQLAGPVAHAEVYEDKNGRSRGMGTVRFQTEFAAVQSICMFDGQSLNDRNMIVRMDKEKIKSTGGGRDQGNRPPPLPAGLKSVGPSLEALSSGGGLPSLVGGRGGGGGGGGGAFDGLGAGPRTNMNLGGGGGGGPPLPGLSNFSSLGGLGNLGGGGNFNQNLGGNLPQGLSSIGSGLGNLGSTSFSGLSSLGGFGNSGSGIGLGGTDFGRAGGSSLPSLGNLDLLGSSNFGAPESLLTSDLERDVFRDAFNDDRGRERDRAMRNDNYDRRDRDRGDRDRDRGRNDRDRDRNDRGSRRSQGGGGDGRSGGRSGGGGGGGGGNRGRDQGTKGEPREGGTQVFVRNLPFSYSWQKLKDIFNDVGNVTYASVRTDDKGRSRGFGTVRFETPNEAQTAIDMLSGSSLEGRQIEVTLDRVP